MAFAQADRLNVMREVEKKVHDLNQDAATQQQELLATQNELLQTQVREMESHQKIEIAESESKAKSEFLASVSHDIRTPMSGVIGMAELLQDTPLDETQRRYVSKIHQSGQALLDVINDVLDFSKIDAGRMRLEKVDYDLEELFDGCVEMMSLPCLEKRIQLFSCIAPGVPTLLNGDPERVRQILVNLLDNAVKFTEHGEVCIKVSVQDSSSDHPKLLFEVSDTGIGMTEEQQIRLFNTFSKTDEAGRKYGGSGLGLTICKRLIELMGGDITLMSEQGKGSCFKVTIPVRRASKNFQPNTADYAEHITGKRMLVVDSNQTALSYAQLTALSWGYSLLGG